MLSICGWDTLPTMCSTILNSNKIFNRLSKRIEAAFFCMTLTIRKLLSNWKILHCIVCYTKVYMSQSLQLCSKLHYWNSVWPVVNEFSNGRSMSPRNLTCSPPHFPVRPKGQWVEKYLWFIQRVIKCIFFSFTDSLEQLRSNILVCLMSFTKWHWFGASIMRMRSPWSRESSGELASWGSLCCSCLALVLQSVANVGKARHNFQISSEEDGREYFNNCWLDFRLIFVTVHCWNGGSWHLI